MCDVIKEPAGAMETVVAHPCLATAGARKILSRKAAANRANAILPLRRAIECLKQFADQPAFGIEGAYAVECAVECDRVLRELEALDPSMPPSAEEIGALSRRLATILEGFQQRIWRCSP